MELIQLLRASPRQPKASHHFVTDEQGSMLAAQCGEPVQKLASGNQNAHVADDGLDDRAGQLFAVVRKNLLRCGQIIEWRS